MKKLLLLFAIAVMLRSISFAAVGCDLNDPDRDVKRFFPSSTGYRTEYYSIRKLGGERLLATVEAMLGDRFKGLYETIDVPYTLYTVLQSREVIGYIHGVNQKGKYGGIQVFLVLDPKGTINDLYFQKMTARYSGKFRARSFTINFSGLKLNDFDDYNVKSGKYPDKSVLKRIANPDKDAGQDFLAIMRAVKKNLILMEVFIFKRGGGK